MIQQLSDALQPTLRNPSIVWQGGVFAGRIFPSSLPPIRQGERLLQYASDFHCANGDSAPDSLSCQLFGIAPDGTEMRWELTVAQQRFATGDILGRFAAWAEVLELEQQHGNENGAKVVAVVCGSQTVVWSLTIFFPGAYPRARPQVSHCHIADLVGG